MMELTVQEFGGSGTAPHLAPWHQSSETMTYFKILTFSKQFHIIQFTQLHGEEGI